MGKFYVYQYWDPIKDEPIYIGKGTGKRAKSHLNSKIIDPFHTRIRWLKKQNIEPIINLIKENLDEIRALQLECQFIKKIGRKDLGKGSLLNLTNGGEGITNPSKRTKKIWSKQRLGKKLTKQHKENIKKWFKENVTPWTGKHHTQETKDKIRKIKKRWFRDHIHPRLGKHHTQETKDKIKEKNKKYRPSEYAKNKISKWWEITTPDGNIKEILNLHKFCKIHKLIPQNMIQHGFSKGYFCKRLKENKENL